MGNNVNINFTILRFGSLYGEGADSNNGINKLILSGKNYKKLVYRGSMNATRRYINIHDAAKLCVQILSNKYKNSTVNITGKKIIKIKDGDHSLSRKKDLSRICSELRKMTTNIT